MRVKWVLMLLIMFSIISASPTSAMTVKDMAGRTFDLKAEPQRIICVGPGALRLITYLKALDRVVGIESMEKQFPTGRPYWIANPQLKTLPIIGPGGAGAINKKPDMEAVLRVRPDLIIATYMEAGVADAVARTLSIPVLVLSYGELAVFDEMVFDSLRLAGKILNRQARAEEVIDFIKGIRKDLSQRTADIAEDAKPGVYVGGIGYRGTHGIESTQRDYIPLDWNNAVNLAQQVKATIGSHVMVDKEVLLSLNPDVIFIDSAGLPLVQEDYRRKPDFYQGLKATRENRVYTLYPFNFYTTNIDTAMADGYAIGKIIFAERFADVDLPKKADEIYTFLLGKPVYEQMQKDFGPLGQAVRFGG
ncbi:putative ABC transporter, periplasmatic binding protein, related to hemin transport system [Desulfosarcina variabilis str. Montpellier]|uniref:iron ABC transporter substrate-binding protein n=1 Tax=Desulfosarcina variabilis TaxID=2300 RepID=UPI003AFABEA9